MSSEKISGVKVEISPSELGKRLFGIDTNEARTSGICIKCKHEAMPRCTTEAGRREFQISGLCEVCFDNIMSEE